MNWKQLKNNLFGKKWVEPTTVSPVRVHQKVKQMLTALQVQWEVSENEEAPGDVSYVFSFQAGRFRLIANAQHTFVQVHYPFFLETPFLEIDNVRFTCNGFNLRNSDFKTYYTVSPKNETVNVHISFNFRVAQEDARQSFELGAMLQRTFEMVRRYQQIYHNVSQSAQSDLEENSMLSEHERYMARELEVWHQHESLQWRENETTHHTIAQLFRTFYEEESHIEFHQLVVLNGGETSAAQPEEAEKLIEDVATTQHVVHDAAAIGGYVLMDALPLPAHDEEKNDHRWATLQVLATVGEVEKKNFLIQLTWEDRLEGNDYVSVLFVEPVSPLSPLNSEGKVSLVRDNMARRFLMVRDDKTQEQREAEFNYQWQEAQDAMLRGEKLTDDQRFMGMSVVPNVAYNLYWGRVFFNAHRYFEALQHLENAYYVLNNNYQALNKAAREHFYEVCYFIGFCYVELKQYERAYFYLDIVYPQNSVRYATEYVNLMVNTRDFRALTLIENVMRSIDQELKRLESEEKEDEGLKSFRRFLLRRKGYVLIERKELDEAEKIFQSLLDYPDSEAQAIDELMYIEQLRAQQQSQTATDTNTDS